MAALFANLGQVFSSTKGFGRLVIAFILGALSTFSFAPYPYFPLFLISISISIILVQDAQSWKQALYIGFALGLGQFGFGVYWIGHSFLVQSQVPVWLAPIAVIFLTVYLSIYMAGTFALAKVLLPRSWTGKAIVFAASFGLFEFLRGTLFTGFPWNPAASIWWSFDFMMQSVSIVGTYGLGFLSVLAGGLLVSLFSLKKLDHKRLSTIAQGVGLLVLIGIWGQARLLNSSVNSFENIRLRLVQANIPQVEKWDGRYLERNFMRYIEMSNMPTDKPVTHIIWSESSIPYDVFNDSVFQGYLASRLGDNKILISGANRFLRANDTNDTKVFNSIFALSSKGNILASYDKTHLVPFGEYIPLRGFLSKIGLKTLVPESFNFSHGSGPQTLAIPGTPSFGPLVCYEIIFPGRTTNPENRPMWILNLTNDAWFGTSSGPYQHFVLARLRAIEEGVSVVRVAGTGISGVIDPYGRVEKHIALQEQDVLDSPLYKPLESTTFFVRYGHLIFFLLIVTAFSWSYWKGKKLLKKKKKYN